MPDLVRLSLSIERPLLERLERMVKASGYTNRSEFVRDMIRDRLVEQEWDRDQQVMGAVTLIFEHHYRGLLKKLTDLEHHYLTEVLVKTHVPLDEDTCVEMILVKGKAGRVKQIADLLRQHKGVLHAALSMSSTGKQLV